MDIDMHMRMRVHRAHAQGTCTDGVTSNHAHELDPLRSDLGGTCKLIAVCTMYDVLNLNLDIGCCDLEVLSLRTERSDICRCSCCCGGWCLPASAPYTLHWPLALNEYVTYDVLRVIYVSRVH
jgi:hypothetical protein